jgi:adenine-specific DNA methylase
MKLIENETEQKLRGGFYTPKPIAKFIMQWAVNGDIGYDILEPSCGDGVFLEQIKTSNIQYNSITAVEVDAVEAKKAASVDLSNKVILNDDFHTFANLTERRFDLVIGNPPYIRYQYFDREQQIEAAKIFQKANLKYSKLTNAWVSFVVGSSLLLKEKGKIGFVLPAEILQVSYAMTLRNFLSHYYNKINIVSFKKLVFPNIQQEVILLLCEKNSTNKHYIEHIEVEDIDDLRALDISSLKKSKKRIDFKSNKWTFYFLEQNEIDFLEEISKNGTIPKLGDFADVEVGITTGSNEFFTVPLSIVAAFELQPFAKPLVGRSVQVSSPIFTYTDWLQNRNSKAKAHLLVFPEIDKLKKYKEALKYLTIGERKGIKNGYKCGIRDEWQIVPSIWISDVLFIRRNNLYPKLIINEARAYTTDTMHRVRIKENINIRAFAASYYNSLSFAFSEISGRSYGGGVLELMPSEVEKILLPYKDANADFIVEIDEMMRKKNDINKLLAYTNNLILKNGYGLSKNEIKLADNIWKKLSKRRLNRNGKSDI